MSSSRTVRSFMAIPAAMLAVTMVMSWGAPSTAKAGIDKYKMSGKWLSRRGTAFIPLLAARVSVAGNPTCLGYSVASPCFLISGGIGADGVASATAPGVGKQLTIPQSIFDGNPLHLYGGTRNVFPLDANPTVIQVSTQFAFAGPKSDGIMKAGFATTSPNGRLAADFTWCEGAAANPACPNPGAGSVNGLVRYQKGVRGFGGTMRMVLSGGGDLSIKAGGQTNHSTDPLSVRHDVIGGGGGSQIFGGAYAGANSNILAGAAITVPGWTCTVSGQCEPGGSGSLVRRTINSPATGNEQWKNVLFSCGAPAAPGCLQYTGTKIGEGAGSTNDNRGFPFTTGQVKAQVTDVANPTKPETFTTTGTDLRGMDGGNITLVAGGVTKRGSGHSFAALERVRITLYPVKEGVPAMAPVGIVTFTTLMALAGGFALRRRSSKKS